MNIFIPTFRTHNYEYLKYYYDTFCKGLKYDELMFVSAGLSYIPFYNINLDFSVRPIMSAALALAAFARFGGRNRDADSYYSGYISSAGAVATGNLENLMFSSYIMATLKCLYEMNTEEVLIHCTLFCLLVKAIFEDDILKEKRSRILALWHAAVRSAYRHYWVRHNFRYFITRPINVKHKELNFQLFHGQEPIDTNWRRSSLDKLLEMLDISAPFAYKPGPSFDNAANLHNFLIYLQIYMERFLFQAASEHHIYPVRNPATVPFLAVLVKITCLVEQLFPCTTLLDKWFSVYDILSTAPYLSDTAASDAPPLFKCRCLQLRLDPLSIAMLYGSSQLFVKLLSSYDLDQNEDDVLEACTLALTTVLLIWSNRTMAPETTHPALVRRSLFWSGIVLFKGGVSIGIEDPIFISANVSLGEDYVKRSVKFERFLKDYTNEARERFQKNFSGFMDAAKQCCSWNDIWTMSVDGLHLMDYALGYVPWFCTQQTESFWAIC